MYYILFGFFYLVSLLPFFVLYFLSDVTAFILYAVVRYRRSTVFENIRESFPEKSAKEVNHICKQFYRNFTDNWIETIKLMSMTPQTLRKRAQGNFEVFYQMHQQGKAASVISGHLFNWEYLNLILSLNQPYPLICVYMPVSSQLLDRLFKYIRSRFGSNLMAATTLNKDIIPWRRKQYLIGLVADQSPGDPQNAYWLQFLQRPTACVTGPERNAKVFNQTPTFVTITRRRRGFYYFDFQLLSANEEALSAKGTITSLATQKTEENIRLQPELYLWSHRRWKHLWHPDYASIWIDQVNPPPGAIK